MGEALIEALLISAKCLLGIFVIITIIFGLVKLLNLFGKPRQKKEDPDGK